jgi:hypothetical protein
MRELELKRTPLDYPSIAEALISAWTADSAFDNKYPISRRAIRLASAQIAIESGLSSCWNYNLSGMKTSPNNKGGYSWQFFRTRERFNDVQYAAAKAAGPLQDAGTDAGLHNVYLLPKHPWCCFRAFESLQEAMTDHLATLVRKFPLGWAGLLTGDAAAFAHGLRQNGYYTATEKSYAGGLEWRYAQELKAAPEDSNLIWGDLL